ncbi:COesterase domain containing protein, partial [Asbolus verrucosus]
SGSFLSPWAYQRRAREIAFKTASFLNSTFDTNNDSVALFEYLQGVEASDLDAAAEQYHNMEYGPEDIEISQGFYWAPIVEVKNPNAFLTKKMYGLLQAGNVVRVPILMGMASEENLYYYYRTVNVHISTDPVVLKSTMETYDKNLAWLVPNDMGITDEANRTEMGQLIRELYTGGEPLADHLGDGVRVRVTLNTPAIHLSQDLSSNMLNSILKLLKHIFINFLMTENWEMLTYTMMVLTVLAILKKVHIFPVPVPPATLVVILISTDDGDFLYVDIGENLEIRNHPKNNTYGKWVEFYNSLGYDDFDTY